MPKFHQLADAERKAIINMSTRGHSNREIAQIFEKSHTVINKVLKAHHEEGRISAKPRPGRPKITNKRLDKRIQNISECNPYLSASKIRAKLISENQLI